MHGYKEEVKLRKNSGIPVHNVSKVLSLISLKREGFREIGKVRSREREEEQILNNNCTIQIFQTAN